MNDQKMDTANCGAGAEIELKQHDVEKGDTPTVPNSGDGEEDEEEDVEEDNVESTCVLSALVSSRRALQNTCSYHRSAVIAAIKVSLFLGLCIYLGFAFHHSFGDEQSLTLLGLVCFGAAYFVFSRFARKYGKGIRHYCTTKGKNSRSFMLLGKVYRILVVLCVTALVAYVIIDACLKRPYNLVSIAGIIVFVLFMLVLSKHPQKVRWRPVFGGLMLQFVFGLLVLRTSWGYLSFQWVADRATEYLGHTDHGAKFVFGNSYTDHYLAFKVLPTIIVFSSTISILYYLGVMQVAINAISAVMRFTLDTGPMETLHAAFNIFVGWAETVPVVQPIMDDMTMSELHAVMTNGFATVSGGTMAGYILYGAPANHLISASFMSAPAALAMGKLFYPEKKPGRRSKKAPVIKKTQRGIIDAASAGAISSIPVIAYILVHLIAFLSILDFVNDTLAWLGARVGVAPPDYPILSFQYISSYLMWPVALLMGVEIADCRPVARMLGVKIFVNEFLAFEDLGIMRANNLIFSNYTSVFTNATWHWTATDDIVLDATGQVLTGGAISERSATIATYALCGFSDLIAMGMMVGAFSAVAPARRQHLLKVAPRALVSGIMASFLTAAMAGLMTY